MAGLDDFRHARIFEMLAQAGAQHPVQKYEITRYHSQRILAQEIEAHGKPAQQHPANLYPHIVNAPRRGDRIDVFKGEPALVKGLEQGLRRKIKRALLPVEALLLDNDFGYAVNDECNASVF
jgi:hypothetical protein